MELLLKSETKIPIRNRTFTLDKSELRENNPQSIILHSTYLYPEFQDLLNFHKSLGWAGVGYHFFVSKKGDIYQARPLNLEGAHSLGFNTSSIGLCFNSPNGNPTDKVVSNVKQLIDRLKESNDLEIISHTQSQISIL